MAAEPVRNVDQLRSRIDSGAAADKVDFPDPAAAPLGTDAEAGGTPPSRAEVQLDAAASARPVRRSRWLDGPLSVTAYIGMAIGVGCALVLVGWLGSS